MHHIQAWIACLLLAINTLQGQVRVVVGKENLEFQGGPFSFYGVHALTASSAQSSHPMPAKNSQSRTNCKLFEYDIY